MVICDSIPQSKTGDKEKYSFGNKIAAAGVWIGMETMRERERTTGAL